MIKIMTGLRRPDPEFIPRRRLAIGDIHGRGDLLKGLLAKIEYDPAVDQLVFLGDYIDRGKTAQDEMDTLNYIIDLVNAAPGKIVLLRGNHEQMALDALSAPRSDAMDLWRSNGFKDKGAWSWDDMQRLYNFCRVLPLTYETDTHVFAHAGALNGIPLKEQDHYFLIWDRETNNKGYNGKTLVVGHTPMRDLLISPEIVYVDTGAFYSGVLSAYDAILRKSYFFREDDSY